MSECATGAIAELVARGFLRQTDSDITLSRLGEIVVHSGLSVPSVTVVAEALRSIRPDEVNRQTLLCAARLATELHDVRFIREASNRTTATAPLQKWLCRSGAAPTVIAALLALPNGHGHAAARLAVASVSWTRGVSLETIERGLAQMLPRGRKGGDPGPPY